MYVHIPVRLISASSCALTLCGKKKLFFRTALVRLLFRPSTAILLRSHTHSLAFVVRGPIQCSRICDTIGEKGSIERVQNGKHFLTANSNKSRAYHFGAALPTSNEKTCLKMGSILRTVLTFPNTELM